MGYVMLYLKMENYGTSLGRAIRFASRGNQS